MTPFLFWWTNKHTCTLQEAVCHCPVACCVTRQFALPNPAGAGKDGMSPYCHLPYMINQRDRATGNELRLVSCHQHESHVFGWICFALAISSRWYCPDDSDVKAECPRTQASVRHSESGQWNHTSAWNVTILGVAHFEVSLTSSWLWNFDM